MKDKTLMVIFCSVLAMFGNGSMIEADDGITIAITITTLLIALIARERHP